ncbi:hypothetical protein Indivirus_2_27 [Indivirus ILV1]|uniref:Uncharacterized protein n=1 Tax=Indivirus ILV1 TaxID=1977633 RepID=A0A1V0SDB5_9VIRU|nr:hypothetical protein Indivirus_2_27 [Indivirus ILV1]
MALQDYNITFDLYGSLYFSNNTHTYQVNVDGKNNVNLESGDYPIIVESKNIYKLKYLDENSLKNKIRNDDNDEDDDNNDGDLLQQYYPEDIDHMNNDDPIIEQQYINEDMINLYGEHNLLFNFWEPEGSDTNQIKIHNRKDCDIMALYDTYIYDSNNRLIFKSHSPDDSSIYRIRIYPTGELYFRPIGYSERKYILNIFGGELKIT